MIGVLVKLNIKEGSEKDFEEVARTTTTTNHSVEVNVERTTRTKRKNGIRINFNLRNRH